MSDDKGGGRGKNLPPGYCLHEYVIAKTLGAGGFGVTYLARDRNLDKAVAIKEFFPFSFATRYDDSSIGPTTDSEQMQEDYQHLLSRFIEEARTLGKFEHPSVVRVLRYIEANNTAYIIMEYVEGPTLHKRVQEEQLLDEATLRPILLSLIDGLRAVHAHGMLHRDIKPENIVLRGGRAPVLIDFGASREAIGRRGHSVTVMWTPGYAPFEQMSDEGELGPFSDIYALGATAYMALVGSPPADSASRILQDRSVPAVVAAKGRASQAFLEAIDWAIRPLARDRPQDVDAWLDAFEQGAVPLHGQREQEGERTIMVRQPATAAGSAISASAHSASASGSVLKEGRAKRGIVWGAAAVMVLLLVGGGLFLAQRDSGDEADEAITASAKESEQESRSEASPAPAPAASPAPEAPQRTVNPSDQEDFRIAALVDSVEAYQLYLRLHPNGVHAEQARARLRR